MLRSDFVDRSTRLTVWSASVFCGLGCLVLVGACHGAEPTQPPLDTRAPSVTGTTFGGSGGLLESGDDTLFVQIRAVANNAVRTMGYQLVRPDGLVVQRDSVVMAADTERVAVDTLAFALPLDIVPPFLASWSFRIAIFARDAAGNAIEDSLSSVVVHRGRPPEVNGSVTGATRDTIGALRDTLTIAVTATGSRPLTYFGYRLVSPANRGDSIATGDSVGSHVFRLPVPFDLKELLLEVEVFARDRLSLEGQRSIAHIRVYLFPSRPTQILRHLRAGNMVYDRFRNRVYLRTLMDSGPSAGKPGIGVFQVEPPALLPGLDLPWDGFGMDLTVGGDSLLVTEFESMRLGIVDLPSMTLDSTAPIAFTPSPGRYPGPVRVLTNNKAMVGILSDPNTGSGEPGQLTEFDLATGKQTLRTDVGESGNIGRSSHLARTPDGTRMLVFPSSAIAWKGQLYHAAADSFAAAADMPVLTWPQPGLSSDDIAAYWLVGNQLLSGSLTPLQVLGGGSPLGVASVLSADGTLAYVAVPEGVAVYRTADGAEIERVYLPESPFRLLVAPDGSRLFGLAAPGFMVVDLR